MSSVFFRMPHGYVTYSPPPATPEIATLPCLGGIGVTFAAMANPTKVNDQTMKVWSDILQKVLSPKSCSVIPDGKMKGTNDVCAMPLARP